jgi:hypothetical protein
MTSAALGARVGELLALPDGERETALRELLRTEVHDPVMRLTVDHDDVLVDELRELAALLRDSVPEGVEDRLPPRVRVFIRLLRREAFEPAWTLAHDNASGVVRPTRAASMWAGGSFFTSRLPLPTLAEDGQVYAWLPGFRDPRYDVPDEVYAIDREVVLRGELEVALLHGRELRLFGIAYLGQLEAGAQDRVSIEFSGPEGAKHRAAGVRVRRPDHVKPNGPDLTRLAWSGWYANVDLRPLLATPGAWRANLELEEQGVRRTRRLGRDRGPLAQPELTDGRIHETSGHTVRLDSDKDGTMVLRIARLGGSARVVPRPVRRAVRRLRPR